MADQAPTDNPLVDDLGTQPQEAVTPVAAEVPLETEQGRDPKTGHFTTKHPAYLREAAADFGFSEEDIAGYSTDQLGAVVVRMQRRLAREQADTRAHMETRHAPEPTAPKAAPVVEDNLLDMGLKEDGTPWTEEDVSGPILRVLKKQAERIKQLQGTSSKVDELQQRETSRRSNTARALLDEAFEALGDADIPLLGKGGISDIGGDSVEAKRRNAIIREAGIDVDNDTPKQIVKKIKAARDVLYPTAAPAPAGDGYEVEGGKPAKKPKVTGDDWKNGGLVKPTQRKADDLPLGEERAKRNLAIKLAEMNGANAESEIEGLLP